MKRNVIISDEFTITEVNNAESTACGSASEIRSAPALKKSAARIEALRAAGVDVSNYFPIGEEIVVKVVDGIPTEVTDDDPVIASIWNNGYINHYRLYRRWITAQMFRMLRNISYRGWSLNESIRYRGGYEYSWKVLEEEFYAQMKMAKNGDMESLAERQTWFDKGVARDMAEDYICQLKELVAERSTDEYGRPRKRCKGVPYVTLCGENIFIYDLTEKIYNPLRVAQDEINHANTPRELWESVHHFNKLRKRLTSDSKMANSFVDAYKGSGGYYTMKNLIMFHGATFELMSRDRSLAHLESKTLEYKNEGWRMIGLLKKLITDSGISIDAKLKDWRK